MLIKLRKAQGATEYAIFIAAVLIGFIALQVYYQRAVKGNIKQRADSVGDQFTTTKNYGYQTVSQSVRENLSGAVSSGGIAGADDTPTSWSNSRIMSDDEMDANFTTALGKVVRASDAKGSPLMTQTGYAGYEYSASDYIQKAADTSKGTGTVGTHDVMHEGNMATRTPWEDAGTK